MGTAPRRIIHTELAFNAPPYILKSSGTTGQQRGVRFQAVASPTLAELEALLGRNG
jgi:acyl-coenzyme A synthetase/AMP-(fatty) acid ligase